MQQNIILKSSSTEEILPAAGLSNLLKVMDDIMEFAKKKRSTDTFTLDVYEQQSKNLDQIEKLMEGPLDQ